MADLLDALIIFGLVVVNGLFVAAEFALIGAPRAMVERHAQQGQKAAILLRDVLNNPQRLDRFIATAQLGVTIASLALGMYGEKVMAGWIMHWFAISGLAGSVVAHSVASVLAVSFLTYLHIVIGEMVPKSMALQDAEKTAMRVAPYVRLTKLALYPLVIGLNGLGNMILKMLRINRTEASEELYHSPEELQFVIRESQEGGMLRPEAGQVLQELLEFGDLTAEETMVPRTQMHGIPLGARPEEVAKIIKETPHSRYPIYENDFDHIVGMITIKDILRHLIDKRPITANDTQPLLYLPESASLENVLKTMREKRTQMAIIMDEHGGTAGLVTIEDLFEEVVGDIDEGKSGKPDLEMDGEGRLRVAGTVRLEEVGDKFNITLEHEAVDTVSGLVLAILGRPPKIGDAVSYFGLRFEVTEVIGHGVGECLVWVENPPETG